ncbi:MAG: tRNA (N6-isopentenyl adenosine(37)-C2)-methylthiotransferase MiaB [Rickettsiales bacterium]|jgi:tRNA-2-methylthio-N6-dimethylallyladenosine synthase|nr:tRNA (N6-isopentenyl adenosine(37)-C2)-methylthiotransferase MiaB [Rickettsiales bacterium]
MRKVFLKTFGCQANFYDSARIRELFLANGYGTAETPGDADVFVLNTCSVREKAGEKVFSELGRVSDLRRARMLRGQRMVVVVAGCVAKAEGENIFRRMPMVDIILSSENYHRICSLASELLDGAGDGRGRRLLSLGACDGKEKFALLPKKRIATGVSEMVTVQEGCNKFCSYCSVPFTRGREYSRPVQDILEEIGCLVDQGAREITLLGQNVDSYRGLDRFARATPLSELLAAVNDIGGIERIRYLTSYPSQFGDDLIAAHRDLPKLMPLVYIPVQSGSNAILRAMNRSYRVEQYLELIQKIRDSVRGIAFSSDFIVGFPGETERDFEDTLELAEKVGYGLAFSFRYSPRPNTPAMGMANQIPEDVKARRLKILQAALARGQINFNASYLGKTVQVLVENSFSAGGESRFFGKTPHSQPLVFSGDDSGVGVGDIVSLEVVGASLRTLRGKLLPNSGGEMENSLSRPDKSASAGF